MKIKRTSNVVNMLQESARNHNIFLQPRINKIASWMSLKSSEINNYSRNVSAVLVSLIRSSCCQARFSTIVRPRSIFFWELILKMFFCSPELNCSIIFSLFFLRMSKKMDYFLRNLVCRENFLFQYQSSSFHSSEWCSLNNNRSLLKRFCFCLCSACKIFHLQL